MDGEVNEFWAAMEKLVAEAAVIIDRPKGSRHPRYPQVVYPLDYGYLDGTAAMDGGGVDVFCGSLPGKPLTGMIATVDLMKRDTEVKLLLGCTAAEIAAAYAFCNEGPYMKGALILR
jgi:inorganic pyrophosphatase